MTPDQHSAALIMATRDGDAARVASLLESAPPTHSHAPEALRDALAYRSLLMLAAAEGHHETVDVLLAHGLTDNGVPDVTGMHAVHLAARGGSAATLAALAASGHDLDMPSEDGMGHTPAHFAARHGHGPCLETIAAHGGSIDTPDATGRRPLHLAVAHGVHRVVPTLVGLGVDPNAAPLRGDGTLITACAAGDLPMAETLIGVGADVNAPGAGGLRPLHHAISADSGPCVHALARGGADLEVLGTTQVTTQVTALDMAAQAGHLTAWRALLEAGASVTIPSPATGMTPLQLAARLGRPRALEIAQQARPGCLLGQGLPQQAISASVQEREARRPRAAIADCRPMLRALHALGVPLDEATAWGATAVAVAAHFSHATALQTLQQLGADMAPALPLLGRNAATAQAYPAQAPAIRAAARAAAAVVTGTPPAAGHVPPSWRGYLAAPAGGATPPTATTPAGGGSGPSPR
ncbi:ankyrin repeat domain-containing protein [Hydrogenophaga sp.]|uniref:ankyrin repeat domain-containing protein n=1 Tax=Hydrogenophaga sp. TaxID=1904254 RepID=UPI0026234E46|nr:ankyrin repeat domain-containing protein [Hydrogenophaga sp.]MCW5654904.1 ankyrin repeat domain-containing protein [Hydrogenophaga sp.]